MGGLFDRAVRLGLPLVPRRIMWRVARRYVAGETLASALEAVAVYSARGFGTILDVLGEAVPDAARAEAAAAEYRRALFSLTAADPRGYVSVKPTHLGLSLDLALCERLLDELCARAADAGHAVRFEMEDAPTIDRTLEVFLRVRARRANLGCVLQARLFRTADDAARLLSAVDGLNVRLVKGIYLEPARIAHVEAGAISKSYLELAEQLLDGGAFVGFATHDDDLADACARLATRAQRPAAQPASGYEFQLLMGVKEPTAERLRVAGHPVRIYVPYGEDWHAYSLRRLGKNPQIARHVLLALLRRRG